MKRSMEKLTKKDIIRSFYKSLIAKGNDWDHLFGFRPYQFNSEGVIDTDDFMLSCKCELEAEYDVKLRRTTIERYLREFRAEDRIKSA